MKKFTLFMGAMLVSLSVLAAPIVKVQPNAVRLHLDKQQLTKQELRMISPMVEKTFPADAFKAGNAALPDLNKIAQQKQAYSTISMQTIGYGNAKATITPAEGTDNLYYQVAILNEDATAMIAYVGYFKLASVMQYFATTYELLYAAFTEPDYGAVVDPNITSVYLPKGKYIYAIMGYAVNGSSLAQSPSDYAIGPFEITLDGSEYAIKDLNVEVGENNKLNVSWKTNTTPVPEGAAYQVRVYQYPDDEMIADSGYDLDSLGWSTPDSVTIEDNATYEVYVNIWDSTGYALGKPASKTFTVGTDPNAPTDLAVVVDDETMKATFTWTNTLGGSYKDKTVYNQVNIQDEEGNTYIFDNGYNNTSGAKGTSEPLPVGKYTWNITPFYVNDDNDWIYITLANGPDFEVKDVVAPVINSVAIAQTSDTTVFLSIDVTDNAVGITAADMKYNVSGNITLENASLEENGTLKLAGLQSTKTYQIQITATDPSGNTSEAFAYSFTPVKDEVAPKNLTAEIAEGNIFDKYVIINVSAEDDKATAEQLVYIITLNSNVIEMNAKDGQLLLEGLTPETAYEITIAVKDLGGNVCENTVKLQFTTVPLIPIEITGLNSFQGQYYTKYSAYDLIVYNVDEATDDGSALEIVFYPKNKLKIANVYTPSSRTSKLGGIYYYTADGKEIEISAESMSVKFIEAAVSEGVQISEYIFKFEGKGDDGNLYVFNSVLMGLFYEDTWQNWMTLTDVFADTDAPELWVSDDYPVEVDGTTVEIMFGTYDGPWFYNFEYCNEIYTEITSLVLEIQDKNGTALASQAAGSIVNTPTLDEDGAFYFTASLTGLEPETEYTVYIYAKDEAGNEADKIEVSFVTGEKSEEGIENVNYNLKAYKLIRDGQLIIKRGDKEFNVIGSQL